MTPALKAAMEEAKHALGNCRLFEDDAAIIQASSLQEMFDALRALESWPSEQDVERAAHNLAANFDDSWPMEWDDWTENAQKGFRDTARAALLAAQPLRSET